MARDPLFTPLGGDQLCVPGDGDDCAWLIIVDSVKDEVVRLYQFERGKEDSPQDLTVPLNDFRQLVQARQVNVLKKARSIFDADGENDDDGVF